MRVGALLLLLLSCNSDPLYLPEPAAQRSSAIVACNSGQCGEGQACCTKDESIAGTCVEPTSDVRMCFSLVRCDGPEDCPGAVCCDSQTRFGGTQCTSSCDDVHSIVLCHTDADCPPTGAHCCPRNGKAPLGDCLPLCWS